MLSNPSCAPPTALRSGGRRPISTDQPPQAPERLPQAIEPIGQTCASRHDQHLVHGPLPEPVLRNAASTRYRLLLPVKAAKPWPLDFDLAAVEADLALRFPPAVPPPVTTSRMPWTTDCLCIAIHHLGRASIPEARQNDSKLAESSQGLKLQRSRRSAVDVVNLFMALLSFVESSPRA